MNRWIAIMAMGLATAANAPAASPTDVAPPAASHAIVSSAEAAPRSDGARAQPAAFMLDRSHASFISETGENPLSPSGPDPIVAWILAAGFLAIIVVRRTRASQGY